MIDPESETTLKTLRVIDVLLRYRRSKTIAFILQEAFGNKVSTGPSSPVPEPITPAGTNRNDEEIIT